MSKIAVEVERWKHLLLNISIGGDIKFQNLSPQDCRSLEQHEIDHLSGIS